MAQKLDLNAAMQEAAALKAKFEMIKRETEDFLVRSKNLSESGLQEAKELVETAKANWQNIITSLGTMGFATLLNNAKAGSKEEGSKKTSSQKTSSQKKTSRK